MLMRREAPMVGGDVEVRAGHSSARRLTWVRFAGIAIVVLTVAVVHVAPAMGWTFPAGILPSYQLQTAKTAFVAAGNRTTPEITRLTQSAAAGAPLEAVPFYYRAIEMAATLPVDDLRALLDEALKRDPRHYYARTWRARLYYDAGRIPEAVDEILKVIRLNQKSERDYVEAIVDVARDVRNRPLILKLVAQRPFWANAFMQRVEAEIPDDEFQLALASLAPDTFNRYIARLMEKGDYDRAFLIWQSSWSEDKRLTFSWPSDPRFSPENADAPFGWREDQRNASRGSDGLYVFYPGRDPRKVVTQIMMLGSGYRYRLSAWSQGEIKERGGWFEWKLTCRNSEAPIGSIPIRVATPTFAPLTTDVSVPEDCPVQVLSLSAVPGEYALSARLVVREVRIEQLGMLPEVTGEPQAEPGVQP